MAKCLTLCWVGIGRNFVDEYEASRGRVVYDLAQCFDMCGEGREFRLDGLLVANRDKHFLEPAYPRVLFTR